jgi:hypothetical protein
MALAVLHLDPSVATALPSEQAAQGIRHIDSRILQLSFLDRVGDEACYHCREAGRLPQQQSAQCDHPTFLFRQTDPCRSGQIARRYGSRAGRAGRAWLNFGAISDPAGHAGSARAGTCPS